ncbi:MAG: ABC transporter permease, partial [Acidobacteriota bacterium]
GAYSTRRDNLIGPDGRSLAVPSAFVTAGVLPATGARPALGRLFEDDDDRQGGDSFKVLVSHGLWHGHFGGDPQVLGRTLQTSLGTFEVVGVMPQGYGFPDGTQMWFPYQSWVDTQDSGDTREGRRTMRWTHGLGRLVEGGSLEQAQAELDGIGAALAEEYPKTNGSWSPRLSPYRSHTTAGLAPHLRSLFTLTWIFMALAAVNLAGIQLARSVARSSTFALQFALGARGSRLSRQLLLETLVLTLPGAALGLGLAHALLALMPRWIPTSLPSWLDLRLGTQEIGFAVISAVLVAVAAGLAPMWMGQRLDLSTQLAGRAKSAAGGSGIRRTLVIAEVTLATVLLVAAGLLARSFGVLERIDPGFAADEVVAIEMSPQYPGTNDEQLHALAELYQRLQTRLLEVPGVVAVGGTTHLPYLDRSRRPVKMQARGGAEEAELEHLAPILTVDSTPGYFEALGIPIVEGRDFTWSDDLDNAMVIILSRRAAEQLFPGQSAIGKEARIANGSWARVVGVVGDVRYDPREASFGAELYYPITQYIAWRQRLAVRFEGPRSALLPSLRQALAEAAPEAGVIEIRPLSTILDQSLWQSRLLGRLAPFFAVLALLLAGLGIYGLLAHDLAQKRHELGVRSALGAPRLSLARLVLWRGIQLVAFGAVGGVAVSLAATPLLAASLFGVQSRDPSSFGLAVMALLGAGALACLAPAWRAMNVHPTESLQHA